MDEGTDELMWERGCIMIMMIRRDIICYIDKQTDLVMAINQSYIHTSPISCSISTTQLTDRT